LAASLHISFTRFLADAKAKGMTHSAPPEPDSAKRKKPMGSGGWIVAAILGAVFGVAVWFAFRGWTMVPGAITTRGYVIMILGLALVVALGAGLMALLFWSHRKGYDR
jgi:hypothetical protein